jgi:hypothetical protein
MTLLLILVLLVELISFFLYKYLVGKKLPRRGVLAVKYICSSDPNFHPGEYSPSPYMLYRNRSNHFYMGVRQTDNHGYRWHGSELSEDPKKDQFRVLCLGGSTTYSNHVTRDIEKSWCYLLEKRLNRFNHVNTRVINAGLNYAMSSELLAHYIFQSCKINPQLVIIHGPGNDTLAVANGDGTSDYRNTRKSLYFQKRRFERRILKLSAFIKVIYVFWLDKTSLVSLEPEHMPPVEIQNERLKISEFQQYKDNLENMIILMLSKGSRIILAPFVQASVKKIEEFHPGLSGGMILANSKMTQIMKSLSEFNKNIYFLDFDKFEFKDNLFVDSCHLNFEGEKLKAKIIHDFISENNLVNHPF